MALHKHTPAQRRGLSRRGLSTGARRRVARPQQGADRRSGRGQTNRQRVTAQNRTRRAATRARQTTARTSSRRQAPAVDRKRAATAKRILNTPSGKKVAAEVKRQRTKKQAPFAGGSAKPRRRPGRPKFPKLEDIPKAHEPRPRADRPKRPKDVPARLWNRLGAANKKKIAGMAARGGTAGKQRGKSGGALPPQRFPSGGPPKEPKLSPEQRKKLTGGATKKTPAQRKAAIAAREKKAKRRQVTNRITNKGNKFGSVKDAIGRALTATEKRQLNDAGYNPKTHTVSVKRRSGKLTFSVRKKK